MDGSIATFRRGEKIDFDVPADSLPRTTKHSAGYPLAPGMDWVDLIVGNEGTLGVVTEAELQFLPAPGERLGGVVFLPLRSTTRWMPSIAGARRPASNMIEYIDHASLQMMDVPARSRADDRDRRRRRHRHERRARESDSWFATSASDRERFRQFRHHLGERVNDRVRRLGYTKVGTDYAVPIDKGQGNAGHLSQDLERDLRLPYVFYGHIGDAHVHLNTFPSNKEDYERAKKVMNDLAYPVVELGGTVGAEHGLGKRKAHLLSVQYKPDVVESMRAVKRRLDPQGLLGAGTLL